MKQNVGDGEMGGAFPRVFRWDNGVWLGYEYFGYRTSLSWKSTFGVGFQHTFFVLYLYRVSVVDIPCIVSLQSQPKLTILPLEREVRLEFHILGFRPCHGCAIG